MVIVEILADLGVLALRDILHGGLRVRATDREVVLGSMAWTVRALAVGLAAALEALDQGATQDGIEGRQLLEQVATSFSKRCGGFVFQLRQTTLLCGLILAKSRSCVNPLPRKLMHQLKQLKKMLGIKKCGGMWRTVGERALVGPVPRHCHGTILRVPEA